MDREVAAFYGVHGSPCTKTSFAHNSYLFVDMRHVYCYKKYRGAVAQLGECLTGSQEVEGSIPFSSTSFFNRLHITEVPAPLKIV